MTGSYFVYILASRRNGTLYVGVTNDLVRRMSEHKGNFVPGFTREYRVDKLVYFEEYASILEARAREHTYLEALESRVEARAHREGEPAMAI
jgi:putative endonuclease